MAAASIEVLHFYSTQSTFFEEIIVTSGFNLISAGKCRRVTVTDAGLRPAA
jgi:hypothetical protein